MLNLPPPSRSSRRLWPGAAATRDRDCWVQHYTPDVTYIMRPPAVRVPGETMTTFPGSHMVAFRLLWSVIGESTGRIICELDNPMLDLGDGSDQRRILRSSPMPAMASGAVKKTSTTCCGSTGGDVSGVARRRSWAPSTRTGALDAPAWRS